MSNHLDDPVTISQSAAIGVSRLLWTIGTELPHDLRVECLHWAAYLEDKAGLPPWPTPGEPTEKVIQFYEQLRSFLDQTIQELKGSGAE